MSGIDASVLWTRPEAAILILAVLLDICIREVPEKLHPTVWMGKSISWLARYMPLGRTGGLACGAAIAAVIPAFWAMLAWLAERGLQEIHPVAHIVGGAVLLSTTFAIGMLHRVADRTYRLLLRGDLTGVRKNMRSLVSRNAENMSGQQAIAATVESVAENTTDSIIGPWMAFALFGLPGAFAYRAINTLDSMIGYRGRFEYLGKASARLDDLVNLLPARLAAVFSLLACLVLPGQDAASSWRVMRRDRGRTASPNAGWTMSAMAGGLGIMLDKAGHYSLGDATRPAEPEDIRRAIRTMYVVSGLGILALPFPYLLAVFFST